MFILLLLLQEQLLELIKAAKTPEIKITVQPVPELLELCQRCGLEDYSSLQAITDRNFDKKSATVSNSFVSLHFLEFYPSHSTSRKRSTHFIFTHKKNFNHRLVPVFCFSCEFLVFPGCSLTSVQFKIKIFL